MARTLWWTSDGTVMVDLSAIVMLEWKRGRILDEDEDDRARTDEPTLEITFDGDSSYCQEINLQHGNELMAAMRDHAGWPEGGAYR